MINQCLYQTTDQKLHLLWRKILNCCQCPNYLWKFLLIAFRVVQLLLLNLSIYLLNPPPPPPKKKKIFCLHINASVKVDLIKVNTFFLCEFYICFKRSTAMCQMIDIVKPLWIFGEASFETVSDESVYGDQLSYQLLYVAIYHSSLDIFLNIYVVRLTSLINIWSNLTCS